MSDIRIRFVIPADINNENEVSDAMIQAYESCKQLVADISWIKESELAATKFTKLDYVVFENFGGKHLIDLVKSKCARVIGPLAVSVCLMEGKPIPSFQWPILNVAMYDCVITCSQLTKSDKEVIKNKVHLMGGLYTGDFNGSVTHLVCNGTKSKKYMLAAETNVKLMLPDWINYIFEASQSSNINANDPQILQNYKCPPFYQLTICTTGINSSKEKAKLAELIKANGGKMVAKLKVTDTDVLICHGPGGTTSDKYKAASNCLSCVTLDWAYDSIAKGYALPFEQYPVKTVTSTPIKEGENVDPNFSTISYIGGASIQTNTINETVNITQKPIATAISGCASNSSKRKASEELVDKIDIKKVKSAGQFLDGCSVFVVGFNSERRDKLNKIVNQSGATRYDEYSERITHIIVGDPTCSEFEKLKTIGVQCPLVSLQWLLDSLEQKRPEKEDKYLITNKNFEDDVKIGKIESPLNKKALNLLKSSSVTTSSKVEKMLQNPTCEKDDALTEHYLKKILEKDEDDTLAMLLERQNGTTSVTTDDFKLKTRPLSHRNLLDNQKDNNQTLLDFKPHETSTQVSQVTSDYSQSDTGVTPIFQSINFLLDGFDKEDLEFYQNFILYYSGAVVDKEFKGVPDYAVVSTFTQPKGDHSAQEVVNSFWLKQCGDEECVCDIEYYHRPTTLPSTKPLQDCVVTISVYTGYERLFLKEVIEGLGGISQEQFSKKNIFEKNVLISTHLVSPEASGKKYEAAVRWNIPVVEKDWLLECVKTGMKVSVDNFLINEHNFPKNRTKSTDSRKSHASSDDSEHNATAKPSEIVTPRKNYTSQTTVSVDVDSADLNSKQDPAKTPINQIFNFNQKDTPEACSQVTPINKILQKAMNDNVLLHAPPSPKTYYPWDPKTPDTPLGAFIRPNPSPRLRKEMQKYVNSFPEFVPPKKRLSTPLSELKRRLRDKVLGKEGHTQNSQDEAGPTTQRETVRNTQESNSHKESENIKENHDLRFENNDLIKSPDEPQLIENVAVHRKLQELQQKVMSSGSANSTRRSGRMFESSANSPGIATTNHDLQSQVCTVGWDYGETETQISPQKVFLLSGIEEFRREELSNELKNLGGIVLESSTYNRNCTHLICPKPGRNEKTLACMAAGKWILHVSYVEKCAEARKFLDEEEFEFGNPKARHNITYEEKDCSIYYWRKEVKRRGYGAFNDMRAIVVAEKKEPITNVIEAGGGVVVHVTPPFDDTIYATHCLLESKMVKDFSNYVSLARQGIKCVNTIYINDFLWRIKKEESDNILPYFTKFY